MIIFDSIIFSLQKSGGISLYWSKLLHLFSQAGVDFRSYSYSNENIFFNAENNIYQESSIPVGILRYTDFRVKLSENDIFHSSYYRISNSPKVKNITTVHDFTYEIYFSGLRKKVHEIQKHRAIKKSSAIICISENTKKDLMRFCPFVNEDDVTVIYNGVSNGFYPIKNLDLSSQRPFFLFVGDRSNYKNFHLAVSLTEYFSDFKLVVVGKEFNDAEKKRLFSIHERVEFLGHVTEEKLNFLYNSAFCLLYPSSYEGFGIPVVEAMKAGCPVIASNSSSVSEIAASPQTLFDSLDIEAMINIVENLKLTDFRNRVIVEGLDKSSNFTWERCFEETFSIYKKFL